MPAVASIIRVQMYVDGLVSSMVKKFGKLEIYEADASNEEYSISSMSAQSHNL